MRLPFYNSRSATLAFVVKGKGYFEMVCPHLSRQRQRQGQEEGSRGQGEEGKEEGSRGQGQEKGEEKGSRGQGQEKGEEEGRRGQGQEKGKEEGSRGQGQEKGEEEEGSRGQGQEGQEREDQGQGEEREARIQYEKVRASLFPNTVHYVPPAHPFITVATSDAGLQIIYFELFAHGNQRNYLAGRNNILRSMGKEEAELSYDTSAKEMQDIVHAQDDIGFSKGPQRGRGGGGSHMALESIMDFMGF